MFTGIVETLGTVTHLEKSEENLNITVTSDITQELKIDQSVAHNGVCLTVVTVNAEQNTYEVTAISESLSKTNLSELKIGDQINLERCVKVSDRLDGHIVQGHIDQTGTLQAVENQDGSYMLTFTYEGENITVEKGSVCVNGVSLTVVNSSNNKFSTAIIPYTWEYTNCKDLKIGDKVNIEFDILGKYIQKLYSQNRK